MRCLVPEADLEAARVRRGPGDKLTLIIDLWAKTSQAQREGPPDFNLAPVQRRRATDPGP